MSKEKDIANYLRQIADYLERDEVQVLDDSMRFEADSRQENISLPWVNHYLTGDQRIEIMIHLKNKRIEKAEADRFKQDLAEDGL